MMKQEQMILLNKIKVAMGVGKRKKIVINNNMIENAKDSKYKFKR